jgi:fatty acid desaturase
MVNMYNIFGILFIVINGSNLQMEDNLVSGTSVSPQTEYRALFLRTGVTSEDIEFLTTPRPAVLCWNIFVTFALITAAPWLILGSLTWLGVILAVGVNLHCFGRFAQLIHAGSHGGLHSKPKFNLQFSNILSGFLGYNSQGHRAAHLQHHIFLNMEKDADRIWAEPEWSARKLMGKWVRDLFFISAAQRFLQYLMPADIRAGDHPARSSVGANDQNKSVVHILRVLLLPAAIQVVLVAYYELVAGAEFYFLIYALPIMTLYPATIRLRSYVEHCFDSASESSSRNIWFSRSTKPSLLEHLFVAPLYIGYHFEHHLLPNVPYYNLPRVRERLTV